MNDKKIKLYLYSTFTFLIIFSFWFISKGGLVLNPIVKPKTESTGLAQRMEVIKQGVANLSRLLRGQPLIVGDGKTNEDIRRKYFEDFVNTYKQFVPEENQ
jgi:hypothetical protein